MNPTPPANPQMPSAGAETATHGTNPTGRCPTEAQTATAALSGAQTPHPVPDITHTRDELVTRLRAVIGWVSERDHSKAVELDYVVHELEQLASQTRPMRLGTA